MKNEPARLYSERLDRAFAFAARAHREQRRKGTDVPYFAHPVHVAWILERAGYGEDVVIAGLLHDVLEDTDGAAADIEAEFGAEVLALVQAATEQKQTAAGEKRPWRVRKQEQIEHLRATGDERVVALKAADAAHNAWSIVADYRAQGAALWERFNAGPADQAWRYRTVAAIVREKLGDAPIARELERAAEGVAEAVRDSSVS